MAYTRRRLLAQGAVLAGSALLARSASAGIPPVAGRAVSFGKVDITPAPVGTYMDGYETFSGPRTSIGLHSRLYVRCLIFWHDDTPRILVTADVLALSRTINLTIRHRLAELGIPQADFALTATHTHNSVALADTLNPYIAYDTSAGQLVVMQANQDNLVSAIVGLVRDTLASPRIPCTLDYRIAHQGTAYNRERLTHAERDVPILVARSPFGDPIAVLFGYGCHPVTADMQIYLDSDYPGEAVSQVERLTGVFAQFILGPAGDQNPRGHKDWPLRKQVGRTLGRTVVDALTMPGRPVHGPTSTEYRDILLPLDITNDPAILSHIRAAYAYRQATSTRAAARRHALTMIRRIDAHSFATAVPLPLQVWRFGGDPPLRLALSGGELVSDYAAHLRLQCGGSDGVWVAGYANEIPAYIPSDRLLYTDPGIYYACGFDRTAPGIAGGAMTVYGWVNRFRGRRPGTTTQGVEQLVIGNLTEMLA